MGIFSKDKKVVEKKVTSGVEKVKSSTGSARRLFFKGKEENQISESFRLLRTNLHFMDDKENRIVVVTSTIPKEGKSSVASNYAMSEAIAGKKVLIVDCDIRRPRAHKSFGIEIDKGLADVLAGNCTIDEAIVREIETNLDLLPSKYFRGNVTEMFLSKTIAGILKSLKERYDVIVLDTAPLTIATDALLLGEYSDGMIFVVGYNMVTKKELNFVKDLIDRSRVNVYGVVMNKVTQEGYSYGNYGYYSYSYKYYNDYVSDEE